MPITFDRNELETCGWCHSVRLVKTHRLICNMTYLSYTVTLTWRDLRSNFKIGLSMLKKHMDGSGLTRGTRWYQACSPSLSSLEVIHEKTLPPKKTIFLALVTSRTYSIRPIANLRAPIDSWDPGQSLGCLTILLASIVIEIIAISAKIARF